MEGFSRPRNNAWGRPIASWTYASDVTAVDFTDLGGYRDLLVFVEGITNDAVSSAALYGRTSINNGVAFAGAALDYSAIGSTATDYMGLSAGTAAGTLLSAFFEIYDFNDAARKTKLRGQVGTPGSASSPIGRLAYRNVAEVNNALRLAWTAGANFKSGSILLYGRR